MTFIAYNSSFRRFLGHFLSEIFISCGHCLCVRGEINSLVNCDMNQALQFIIDCTVLPKVISLKQQYGDEACHGGSKMPVVGHEQTQKSDFEQRLESLDMNRTGEEGCDITGGSLEVVEDVMKTMVDNLDPRVDIEPKAYVELDMHRKPEITGKFMVENKDIVEDSLNIVGDDKVTMPLNEQSRSNHIELIPAQAKDATAQKADEEAKLKTEADAVIEISADSSSESKAVFTPGSNANPTKESSSGSNDGSIRNPSFKLGNTGSDPPGTEPIQAQRSKSTTSIQKCKCCYFQTQSCKAYRAKRTLE